eukprot:15197573-Alexandrium_andersonii.AAC.1
MINQLRHSRACCSGNFLKRLRRTSRPVLRREIRHLREQPRSIHPSGASGSISEVSGPTQFTRRTP